VTPSLASTAETRWFDAGRGLVVGLWAKADVYPLDEAMAVAQRAAASVGVSPP
jgi:hypothetical protein